MSNLTHASLTGNEAFRYEGFAGGAINAGLKASIGAYFAKADRHGQEADLQADWTVCRCALHETIKCGVAGAEGCEGGLPGEHSALKGLYGAGHRACVVEPGARVRDHQLLLVAEKGTRMKNCRRHFMTGRGTPARHMGAGFCYTALFDESVVVRVARLLGPLAPNHRVLRYFLLLGRRGLLDVGIERLSSGRYHVRQGGGMCMTAGAVITFFLQGADPNGLIGIEEERLGNFVFPLVNPAMGFTITQTDKDRFGSFVTWAAARGLEVDRGAEIDFVMATKQSSLLPVGQPLLRVRVRGFELLGDRVLKMVNAARALARGMSMGEVAVYDAGASNVNLASFTSSSPLADWLDVVGLPAASKARGDVVESLLGVVCAYHGFRAAGDVMDALGLPVIVGGPLMEVSAVANEVDSLAQAVAFIVDFQHRGGEAEEVRKKLRQLLDDSA